MYAGRSASTRSSHDRGLAADLQRTGANIGAPGSAGDHRDEPVPRITNRPAASGQRERHVGLGCLAALQMHATLSKGMPASEVADLLVTAVTGEQAVPAHRP